MSYDIFISYSARDSKIADEICTALDSNGISCWIANRDIIPGSEWAESIVDAIDNSRSLLLILSANSNDSPQVIREVARAANNRIPIFPIRIDDVTLSKSLDFFVSSHQWLDAQRPPLEEHFQKLANNIRKVLEIEYKKPEIVEGIKETETKPQKTESIEEEAKELVSPIATVLEDKVPIVPRHVDRESHAREDEEGTKDLGEAFMPKRTPFISDVFHSNQVRLWVGIGASVAMATILLLVFGTWTDDSQKHEEDSQKLVATEETAAIYSLSLSVDGSGTTSPEAGSYDYDDGTQISITALPSSGWEFDHWGGDYSETSSSIDVTVDSDISITAHFKEKSMSMTEEVVVVYDIFINIIGMGTTSPKPGSYEYDEGASVTITAIPNPGWEFETLEWRLLGHSTILKYCNR